MAQLGVRVQPLNYDISATFQTLDFEMIHFSKRGGYRKLVNTGGTFSDAAKKIIRSTLTGDIYAFKDIRYRVPGSDDIFRAEDMIIEIK